jgi:hypothetical protein
MSDTYRSTFIQVATDCSATEGTPPPQRGESKSIANLEYEMLAGHPYEYTQEEVQFAVHLAHKGIPGEDTEREREAYFSVPHACLRASPLAKRYGWGFHFDADGRVALVPMESPEYAKHSADKALTQVFAMRSKRA